MIALEHDLHQLVLQFPGCVLRHAQTTAQFDTGPALLALGQVVHGRKPCHQGQFGRVENRAGDQRGLMSEATALVDLAAFDDGILRAGKAGQTKPFGQRPENNSARHCSSVP